jgi:hypothetical protein
MNSHSKKKPLHLSGFSALPFLFGVALPKTFACLWSQPVEPANSSLPATAEKTSS